MATTNAASTYRLYPLLGAKILEGYANMAKDHEGDEWLIGLDGHEYAVTAKPGAKGVTLTVRYKKTVVAKFKLALIGVG